MTTLKPITVVIPLVHSHDQHVSNLLDGLAADGPLIEEVVLSRSGLARSATRPFVQWANSLSESSGMKVTVAALSRRATAGENRNRGWGLSASQYTAFLDADDSYETGRLTALLDVAEHFEANLVLHDHFYSNEDRSQPIGINLDMSSVVGPQALHRATFPNGRRRELEGRVPGDTNIELPAGTQGLGRVGHGYAFVRTAIREDVTYGLRYPGEDGQFCRDVLWQIGGVYYLPAQLATYRREFSAEYGSTLRDKLSRRLRASQELGLDAFRR